jgi:hypothetical protein
MDDFKWIQNISSRTIKVLELLNKVDKNMPPNFNNKYHERRDLIKSFLNEAKILGKEIGTYEKFNTKDSWSNFYNSDIEEQDIIIEKEECFKSFEDKMLCRLVNNLNGLYGFVTSVGTSGAKNPWYKRYTKKRVRNFKKSIKKMIKDITENDTSYYF